MITPGGTSGSRIFLATSTQLTTGCEMLGARAGAAGVMVAPEDCPVVTSMDRGGAEGGLVVLTACPLDKSVDWKAILAKSGGDTADRFSADGLSTSRASRDCALIRVVHWSSVVARFDVEVAFETLCRPLSIVLAAGAVVHALARLDIDEKPVPAVFDVLLPFAGCERGFIWIWVIVDEGENEDEGMLDAMGAAGREVGRSLIAVDQTLLFDPDRVEPRRFVWSCAPGTA